MSKECEGLFSSGNCRRPGSAQKHKELSGSGIFNKGPHSGESSNAFANNNDQNNGNYITDRPSTRVQQVSSTISHLADDLCVVQKKGLSALFLWTSWSRR
jgi:hypothetical protein